MAHIAKVGEKWRAEVCIDRKRRAKTFKTKRECVAWANEQEEDGILAQHTLRDCIAKYKPIAETRKGYQPELSRLRALEKMNCIDTPLEYLTPAMIAAYRDERLKQLASVSVRRELIMLRAMLRIAVKEWGWLRSNPASSVTLPATSKPRQRGVLQDEVTKVVAELRKMRVGPQVAQMFLLGLETGMRLSELLGLRWEHVEEKYVVLFDTKNGDSRPVPLSMAAREIINQRRGIDDETVFTLSSHVASKTFSRARDKAGITGLHFHDSRSEAITRISKKIDVMQLAKMIGHRDLRSLLTYYAEPAESIADRL